jgi:uncharacterized iron-regulated membrane protein
MSSTTYRGLWRWHFHAGLFCIPFVIVLAVSGSIFLFKPQIDAFADRGVDRQVGNGVAAAPSAQAAAAMAAVPDARVFVYELPRTPHEAIRVQVYDAAGTGRIVYVHPQTLAILKQVPVASRFTEIVRTLHGELLAGTAGSLLVELAASWAIVMLVTGMYLWWPREARGLGGVVWPRLFQGRALFWRDLHAVTGVWVSALAMFLLATAQPWTTVWGGAFTQLRAALAARESGQDWSLGREQESHQHAVDASAGMMHAHYPLDAVVQRARERVLEPPVRIHPPSADSPWWRVASETPNRPRQVELRLDAHTGEQISEQGFADKPLVDRVIGVGIAAHEGQLFGPANQALGLFTALGLVAICVSAVVMWWRRTKDRGLGVPARQVAGFRISGGLLAVIALLGVLLPVLGIAMLLIALTVWLARRWGPRPA